VLASPVQIESAFTFWSGPSHRPIQVDPMRRHSH
jgi:hypothetical protein